jgi:hypothetical protein
MCKKLIFLSCFVLVLNGALTSQVDAALPGLVGWWKFDGDLLDSSGLGNDGTAGGDPTFVVGKIGTGAVDLDGNDYVVLDAVADDVTSNEITLSAWVKTSDSGADWFSCNSSGRGNVIRFVIDAGRACFDTDTEHAFSTTLVSDDQWHHLTLVLDGSTGHVYVDGVEENSFQASPNFSANDLWSIGQEWDSGGPSGFLTGIVDDVQIYNRALTQKEIEQVIVGVPPGAASNPSPENEETDVYRDADLSWTPGDFAPAVNGHRVHLSSSFNDVNDGLGAVTQSAAVYDPGRLNLGATYYWRVDEVNAPPDSTVHRGEIWSFTTEPIAYPVSGANINATASSSAGAEFGPEKTIDGSGLDDNGLHSTEATDMWLSGNEPQGAWIQYELDKVYKLHEMWVWNSNQVIEAMFGFGMKDVTVEYSTNGTDWTALADVPEFTKAPGAPGYAHDTTVGFGGATAKYVKLTAASNWGGILPQFGLSEVRFFYIPVSARKPSPDSGAADVAVEHRRAGRDRRHRPGC